MAETAWHALMTELAVGTATDPALKELYRDIDDNLQSTFTALLTSSGLFDTAQEARVLVRSLLAAVHGFALELIVDREAVSRDDVAPYPAGHRHDSWCTPCEHQLEATDPHHRGLGSDRGSSTPNQAASTAKGAAHTTCGSSG